MGEWLVEHAERQVGRELEGQWKLVRLLGVGGTAAVYEGHHRSGQRVAIKVLRPDRAMDPRTRARFLREAYAANAVGHPQVVGIADHGDDEGSAFLVMELLDGESLDRWAAHFGSRVPWPTVLTLMSQLLEVLEAAHQRKIIHRDLKPANLFLTRAGRLKVLDFGLARVANGESSVLSTEQGALLGTPAFMAPEQARGAQDEVTARTDVWSAGATAFKLLSGRHVYEAETVNEQLACAMTLPAPLLRDLVPDLPPAVARVIQKALEYEPERRWESAGAMLRELKSASLADDTGALAASGPAGEQTQARTANGRSEFPPTRQGRATRNWKHVVIGLLVSIVVAAAWSRGFTTPPHVEAKVNTSTAEPEGFALTLTVPVSAPDSQSEYREPPPERRATESTDAQLSVEQSRRPRQQARRPKRLPDPTGSAEDESLREKAVPASELVQEPPF